MRHGRIGAVFGAVLGIATAQAQGAVIPVGGLDCEGKLGGAPYSGQAVFELITAGPDTNAPSEAESRALLPAVHRGETAALPGTLRVYGTMQGTDADPMAFEAYLGLDGAGIGSLWYEGQRRDEVIVRVALDAGGFRISGEESAPGRFSCTL